MKNKKLTILAILSATFSGQTIANTNMPEIDVLTGDTRTACEVILCLSSAQGKGIAECQAPLRKYFSIKAKRWSDTLRKRRSFLDLCPAANENAKMSALTTAIQHQEYACDADTLNSRTETKRIWGYYDEDSGKRNQRFIRTQTYMPQFCQALYNHEFTEYSQIQKPKYTCNPNKWYSLEDWNRGYEKVVVSRKWNRRFDSYDIEYKDVPIKKDCWE
ncbi:TrbM/KikA/MpfK family conjugal transfer protein [Volucribacter amazonae]|uniref:TrbM protein n=1 Tax=Volucribacter amazonae TaxID=256731 RepID=A0A9X4PJ90_9PAST|nr:TrbM/KikA/MpfK family conjugal transfer protein [Volucribacter amazonae]MDG6896410.1 hypothetical protein [Volucribacter amazonae]